MEFISLVNSLQKRLQEPLPGWQAQKQMLPFQKGVNQMDLEAYIKKVAHQMRESAVMVLLYPHQGEIYFPLMQRYDYEGLHSGQISFPGGKVDADDHSFEGTALRETEEEFGVPANNVQIIGRLSRHVIPHSRFYINPIVGYLGERPNFVPDQREVAQIIEVGLENLLKDHLVEDGEFMSSNGYRANAPFFRFNERFRVWGATSMMLNELKVIIKEIM